MRRKEGLGSSQPQLAGAGGVLSWLIKNRIHLNSFPTPDSGMVGPINNGGYRGSHFHAHFQEDLKDLTPFFQSLGRGNLGYRFR